VTEPPDLLFICASFFGYAGEIRAQLERRGRRVALYEDRPSIDSVTKALTRAAPALVRRRAEAYFASILDEARAWPIRDVLVIKGEALSPAAVRNMRAAFPHARFTLYFWDSYRNMPKDSRAKAALFDRVLSFDPRDTAADPTLVYRPLFYSPEYPTVGPANGDIDVLFFGSLHGDRHAVLQRIARALPPQLRFERTLYLPARWLYFAHAVFDPSLLVARRENFIHRPLAKHEVLKLIARARIVVDIERPVQTGYTMRTVEMLGAGRKLITTNAQIASADFYDPGNIAIIDRGNPRIGDDFLSAPYRSPPPDILKRYSLESWLDEVLPPRPGLP